MSLLLEYYILKQVLIIVLMSLANPFFFLFSLGHSICDNWILHLVTTKNQS